MAEAVWTLFYKMEDSRGDGSSSLWHGYIVNNVFYKQWFVKKNFKIVLIKPAV